jgi:DtxR family Mn-dependent transcriptional regulator
MVTSIAEEYLEAIYRLGGRDEPVPLSSLAEHLDLVAVSVNEMVRRLEEQHLVRYTPYRGVLLEEEGLRQALALLRRHRLWERFLTDMLGIPWDRVHEEACKLEHAASEQVTEKLSKLLGSPERCPHGRPMPVPGCELVPDQGAIPLADMAAQQEGQVAYIAREEPELLRYLETLGILPNAEVLLEQIAPFDGPFTVRVNGVSQVMGRNAALAVFVQPLSTGGA